MEQINLTQPENKKAEIILTGFFKRTEDLIALLAEACRLTKKEDGPNN